VRQFERSLSVSRSRGSDIVELGFRNPDPAIAQAALGELVRQEQVISTSLSPDGSVEFYGNSIRDLSRELTQAQAQLDAFRAVNGVAAFREQLPVMLRQRQDLDGVGAKYDRASELSRNSPGQFPPHRSYDQLSAATVCR
jgi:uncharacterized protein involved in exopolysaccharide biosynthesis